MRAPGVPTVLICLARETEKDAAAVENAVRAVYADPKVVLVAHVVDLRKIPGMFRKIAEGVLAAEHKKAVESLKEGHGAFDYVVILPDWQGEVANSLDLPEPSQTVCGAVLSADGHVIGTFEGTDGKSVLMLIHDALTR